MFRFVLRSGFVRGAAVLGGACLHACQLAHNAGANSHEVACFSTSGLIFKDTLKLYSLTDPKVEGVTIYLTDSEYNTIDKVANFFSDPSNASITCVQTGPITIHKDAKLGSEGEDIYEESRNMFFKVRNWYSNIFLYLIKFFPQQIRIRRVIDKQSNTLVYIAYTTRISTQSDSNKSRFRSSVCALPLPPTPTLAK